MTPEQQKDYFKKTFTLQGRIFHANLLRPIAKKDSNGVPSDRETYDVQCVWAMNSNPQVMQEINQFLQHAGQSIHAGVDPRVLVMPIKRFDTYLRQDGRPNPPYVNNCYWVNASTGKDFPPQVVGMDRMPVMSEAEVYSGRNALFNISFYAMQPKQGSRSQKRGFGVNINAVMLMEGGQREGGGVSVDINQVFGNIQADMGVGFGANPVPPVQQAPSFNQGQQYTNQPQNNPYGQQSNQQAYGPGAAPAPQNNPFQGGQAAPGNYGQSNQPGNFPSPGQNNGGNPQNLNQFMENPYGQQQGNGQFVPGAGQFPTQNQPGTAPGANAYPSNPPWDQGQQQQQQQQYQQPQSPWKI